MTQAGRAAAAGAAAVLALFMTLAAFAWWQSNNWCIWMLRWMSIEFGFAVWFMHRHHMLNAQQADIPAQHDPVQCFQQFLSMCRQYKDSIDGRTFFVAWFHGAQFEELKRDNVTELLAYLFWYKSRSAVIKDGCEAELQYQLRQLEELWGMCLPTGYNSQMKHMAVLWEPLKVIYRPLAYYSAMEAASAVVSAILLGFGFARHQHHGLSYWTYGLEQPSDGSCSDLASSRPAPILLLHGIGMELLPYLGLLPELAAQGRPLILVSCPHIGQRVCCNLPTVSQLVEALSGVMAKHQVHKVHVMAHSYGTLIASRLLRMHPNVVGFMTLIDPVCFGLCMPHFYALHYRNARDGSWAEWLKDVMMCWVLRDIHIAGCLCRGFYWGEVILWPQDLPHDSLVVLHGKDELVEPHLVRELVQPYAGRVLYHEDLSHAAWLLDHAWQNCVLCEMTHMIKDRQVTNANRQALAGPITRVASERSDDGWVVMCPEQNSCSQQSLLADMELQ